MNEKMKLKVDAISQHVDKMQSRLDNFEQRRWKEFLGDHLAELLISREATVQLFANPDPKLRRGAFTLERSHWLPRPNLESMYIKAALNDPDQHVRAEALSCFAYLYHGSGNKEISATLAGIIRTASNLIELRRAAYHELFQIQGRQVPIGTAIELLRVPDDLPKLLDWSFVDSFL